MVGFKEEKYQVHGLCRTDEIELTPSISLHIWLVCKVVNGDGIDSGLTVRMTWVVADKDVTLSSYDNCSANTSVSPLTLPVLLHR